MCFALGLLLGSGASGQIAPAKTWFAPDQPLIFSNLGEATVELVMTDFMGRRIESGAPAELKPGEKADLKSLFPAMLPGTYVLYPVPPGGATVEFTSTPWVIGVRVDERRQAEPVPMVYKAEPLRYAVIETPRGDMTVAFYYDVAPNTTDNFLRLAEGGFYDGLGFHRVVPGFVIQAGDPKGDSTGGPGYMIDEEFNDRPHLPGVLSMARSGDPLESQGAMPRNEAANSAGSQFFIALDYEATRRLDGRYTAFGRVVDGMDVVEAIGSAEIADEATGEPKEPQPITRVRVEPVEPGRNPYATLFDIDPEGVKAARNPSTRPSEKEAAD